MKRYLSVCFGFILLMVAVILGCNLLLIKQSSRNLSERKILMNRAAYAVEEYIIQIRDLSGDAVQTAEIKAFCEQQLPELRKESMSEGKTKEINIPNDISFISVQADADLLTGDKEGFYSMEEDTEYWPVYCEEELAGFLVFHFPRFDIRQTQIWMNVGFAAAMLVVLFLIIYIWIKIMKPFFEFADYPKRLAKGKMTEKLPEAKSRFFGSFIWGINMLNDKIASDKKIREKMISERQTMLTTIAHGIKTPVANIKLYAEAIETGLYQTDGVINAADAEIAGHIEENADNISTLVENLIHTSADGMVDYTEKAGSFYLKELAEEIQKEYENRMTVLHIPFHIELTENLLIKSDIAGIERVLSQLLENAIKYGDMKGIRIKLSREEDIYNFSVINHGNLVPENEIPYLFQSFWRGSNAKNVEGVGLGLFEAKTIARKLGGDILCREEADSQNEGERTGWMEFVLCIPDESVRV